MPRGGVPHGAAVEKSRPRYIPTRRGYSKITPAATGSKSSGQRVRRPRSCRNRVAGPWCLVAQAALFVEVPDAAIRSAFEILGQSLQMGNDEVDCQAGLAEPVGNEGEKVVAAGNDGLFKPI